MKKLMNMYGKFISTVLAFAMIATTVSTPVFASVTYSDEVVEEAADVVAEQYAADVNPDYITDGSSFEVKNTVGAAYTTNLKATDNNVFTFVASEAGEIRTEDKEVTYTVDGVTTPCTRRIKPGGKPVKDDKGESRYIIVKAPSAGKVYVCTYAGSNNKKSMIQIYKASATPSYDDIIESNFLDQKEVNDKTREAVAFSVSNGNYIISCPGSDTGDDYTNAVYHRLVFVEDKADTVSVNFVVNGTEYAKGTAEVGGIATAPETEPTSEGEEFLGWFEQTTDTPRAEYVITGATTFVAKFASNIKTVSVNVVGEGTVSCNGTKFVPGSEVVVKYEPQAITHRFDSVSVNTVSGTTVSYNNIEKGIKFTMPEEDVNVNVTFAENEKYPITATYEGPGKITVSTNKICEGNEAYAGEEIEIVVTPDSEAYGINEMTLNGEKLTRNSKGKYIFTMPAGAAAVHAVFGDRLFEVKFETLGHGEVAPQDKKYGEKADKPADPVAEGYDFLGWYADGTCLVEYDFNTPITADTKIWAKMIVTDGEGIDFDIVDGEDGKPDTTQSKIAKGKVYGNENIMYIVPGDNMPLLPKSDLNVGYYFQGATNPAPSPKGTKVCTSGAYFDVYAKQSGTFYFVNYMPKKVLYVNKVTDEEAGVVENIITVENTGADYINETEFQINAGEHYQIAVAGSKIMFMRASFYVGSNPVTVSENIVNGSVSVNKAKARPGDVVEITTAPATGYAVDTVTVTPSVSGNTVSVKHVANNKYTFDMPDTAVVVGATFAPGNKVTVSKNEVTDKVLESKSNPAISGRTVEIIAVPNDHYEITPGMEAITVTTASGKNVPLTNSDNEKNVYTFTMVEEDVVVNTNFSKIPTSNIYIESTGKGEVKLLEPASANDVERDTVVYFQAIPAGKGTVKSVKVTDANGNDVKFTTGANNKYNFAMPAVDVTISVVFTGGGSGSGDFEYSYEDTWTFVNAAIKPAVTVTYGGVELAEGTDFAVSYKNNTKVANATDGKKAPTITVTGKGNFAGKVQTLYFNIVPFTVDVNDDAVEVKGGKIALTTKGTKFAFTGDAYDPIADGQLTVTGKVGKDTKTFTTDDFDYVVVNNVNAGTANILLLFKGEYKCAKPVKGSFKIEKADATKVIEKTSGSIATVTYGVKGANPTNDDIAAAVSSTCGDIVLGRDFKVSFKNNKKVATATDGKKAPTVVLTGAGNYKGKVELNYDIAQADIADLAVAFPGVTDGKAINSAKPVILDVNGNEVNASKFVIKYTLNDVDATGKEKVKAGDTITATLTPNAKATEFTGESATCYIAVGTVGKLKATLIKVKDVQGLTEAAFNEVYGEGQYKKLKSKTVASVLGVDQYSSDIDLTADYDVVPGVSTKLVDVTFTAKGQKTGVNVNDDATFTLTSRAKKGSASAYVTVGVADGANGLVKVSLPVAAKTMK